ncbi:MAG TPA: DinB family protein [Chloroflexota bacterium]|jgi:hypothetical protein
MDTAKRGRLLAQYKDGHREVTEALAGLTEEDLDARPLAGEWTAREIVHHLADSEMTSAIRLRRLLVEEQPAILAYDEEAFARHLYYDRPIAASLDALRAARQTTADILDRLSEAEWARAGTHNEVGRYSVEVWLEIYAAHGHDHAEQIRRAREAAVEDGVRR